MKKIAYFIAAITFASCTFAPVTPVEEHKLTFDEIWTASTEGKFLEMVPDCSVATQQEMLEDIMVIKYYQHVLSEIQNWLSDPDESQIRYYKNTRCIKIKSFDGKKDEVFEVYRMSSIKSEMFNISSRYEKPYMTEKFNIPQEIIDVLVKSANDLGHKYFMVKECDFHKI